MALVAAGNAMLGGSKGSSKSGTLGVFDVPDDWRVLHARAKDATGRGLMEIGAGGTRIVISEGDIGNPGCRLIADALNHHRDVVNVNMSSNRIGDEGIVRLAKALQGCNRLQVLCLSFNRISDAGAEELARVIEKHTTLRLLNLDGNVITDVGASSLMGALSTNPRGTDITVGLTSNPVKRLTTKTLENLSRAAGTVKMLSQRGVTLGQLLKFYAAGCANGTIEPETTTTSDVALDIVVPESTRARQSWVEALQAGRLSCPRSGKDGIPAYDLTSSKPTVFVVHAWNGLFRDLLRAIASHATKDPNPSLDLNDPLWIFDAFGYKERMYFIDVFCVNQFATLNQLRRYGLDDPSIFHVGDSACQIDKFHLIAEQIQKRKDGRVLIVVDYNNLVLSRTLCLKEVHQAIKAQKDKVDVSFCRLPSYPYEKMFTPVENSKASCCADKDSTLEEVEDDRGGHQRFDKDIADFMTSSISAKYQEKIQALMPKEIRGINATGPEGAANP